MTLPRFSSKTAFLPQTLLLLTMSLSAGAETTTMTTVDIPVIEGARIFAQFDDKAPAVINYFTTESEASVMDFYQNSYGTPVKQEREYGRLTLSYAKDEQQIRVAITEQSNMRQVDIIVEKAP
ncbi:MAG: hypothetical protein ACPG52_01610 [Cognaticolwellia sp.]